MKSKSELKLWYEKTLIPMLARMERYRKKANLMQFVILFFFLGLLISIIMLIVEIDFIDPFALVVCFLIGLVISAISGGRKKGKYAELFQQDIIPELIKFVDIDYEYSYNYTNEPSKRYFFTKYYEKSKIIVPEYNDRCESWNLMEGVIKNISCLFYEMNLYNKKNSAGGGYYYYLDYKGLFFEFELNKSLENSTFVVSKNAYGKYNWEVDKREIDSYGALIDMSNPEFDKIFTVYGDNLEESKSLITHQIMENILNIYNEYKWEMIFSFTGSKLYCMVPFEKDKDIFAPDSGKVMKMVSYKEIEDIYMILKFPNIIVNNLYIRQI